MTSHASRRTAHPGRSSSFYIIALIGLADKTDYTKRPLPLAKQVTRLNQRGLFSMMKTKQLLIFSILATIGFVHTLIRSKKTVKILNTTLFAKIFTSKIYLWFYNHVQISLPIVCVLVR